jgi:hypothetical protein
MHRNAIYLLEEIPPDMNPLGHRILEILQASPDGHSTAFNVFNVLNRDGYNVTKHEFEEACKKTAWLELHHLSAGSMLVDRYPNRNPRSAYNVSSRVSFVSGCRLGARYRGPQRGFSGGIVSDRRNSMPGGI